MLCTCTRAGWALVTALLSLGSDWVAAQLPRLFILWRRSLDSVGRVPSFEPTHEVVCLDAALHSVLAFVRSFPEVASCF